MGRIDHQLIRLACLGRQCCEDFVEHAQPAPADEAVVDRLGRTIVRRRITPPQAVADHEDDAADDPAVIDPRNPVRQREIGLNSAHLRLRQPDQITHGNASSAPPLNQSNAITARDLIGPEPRFFRSTKVLICTTYLAGNVMSPVKTR
jgi:hypothetical protein